MIRFAPNAISVICDSVSLTRSSHFSRTKGWSLSYTLCAQRVFRNQSVTQSGAGERLYSTPQSGDWCGPQIDPLRCL